MLESVNRDILIIDLLKKTKEFEEKEELEGSIFVGFAVILFASIGGMIYWYETFSILIKILCILYAGFGFIFIELLRRGFNKTTKRRKKEIKRLENEISSRKVWNA